MGVGGCVERRIGDKVIFTVQIQSILSTRIAIIINKGERL